MKTVIEGTLNRQMSTRLYNQFYLEEQNLLPVQLEYSLLEMLQKLLRSKLSSQFNVSLLTELDFQMRDQLKNLNT